MMIVTTDFIQGKRIVKTLGMARGNTIRAQHIGRDIMAFLKNVVGGEITDYTKMMAEAREQSLDRMIEDAERMGANAVISVRFMTTSVMQSAAELLAYGTAVVCEDVER